MGRGLDGYYFPCHDDDRCAVLKARLRRRLSPFPVVMARGKHLFPFRTEQLSPSAPMVLVSQGPGRVGRRRFDYRLKAPPLAGPSSVNGPHVRSVWRRGTTVPTPRTKDVERPAERAPRPRPSAAAGRRSPAPSRRAPPVRALVGSAAALARALSRRLARWGLRPTAISRPSRLRGGRRSSVPVARARDLAGTSPSEWSRSVRRRLRLGATLSRGRLGSLGVCCSAGGCGRSPPRVVCVARASHVFDVTRRCLASRGLGARSRLLAVQIVRGPTGTRETVPRRASTSRGHSAARRPPTRPTDHGRARPRPSGSRRSSTRRAALAGRCGGYCARVRRLGGVAGMWPTGAMQSWGRWVAAPGRRGRGIGRSGFRWG